MQHSVPKILGLFVAHTVQILGADLIEDHGTPSIPDEHLTCHQCTGPAFPGASLTPARCVYVGGRGSRVDG